MEAVPYREAVRAWARIALSGFAGSAGPLAAMRRTLVDQRGWIEPQQFLRARSFCALLPGPEAQQLAGYLGWLQHGVRGGLTAGLLLVTPALLSLVAVAVAYTQLRDTRVAVGLLFGLRVGMLAVLAHALIRSAPQALRQRRHGAIALGAFGALWAGTAPVPAVLAAAALAGVLAEAFAPSTPVQPPDTPPPFAAPHERSSVGRTLGLVAMGAALWLLPLVGLRMSLGAHHQLFRLAAVSSKAAATSFGGPYTSVAYLAQQTAGGGRGLASGELLDGMGLAQACAAPPIQVLPFLGVVAARGQATPPGPPWVGLAGALVAIWASCTPWFVCLFAAARHAHALVALRRVRAAAAGVRAAAAGTLLQLVLWTAPHVLFAGARTWSGPWGAHVLVPRWWSLDVSALLLAAGALFALTSGRVGTVRTVVVCAGLGALAHWGLGVL